MDNYRKSMQHIMIQFDKKGRWYPLTNTIRKKLTTTYAHDIRQIPLAKDNWLEANEFSQNKYSSRLKNWILDEHRDRKSTRLNSSHVAISYAVFCLKKKTH